MNIAVCDDDAEILRVVKAYIGQYAKHSGVQVNVSLFENAQELLQALEHSGYDAFFLDISMKSMSGLELAENIRKKNAKTPIIFITGLSRHMQDAFRLHAFDYILKPVSQTQIDRVLNDLNIPRGQIEIISDRQKIMVSLEGVFYIETVKNQTILVAEKTEYSTYLTQAKMKEMLSESFCQCHKSYIVNMDKVSERRSGKCTLQSGVVLPIGRKYAQEFKERYFEYLREKSK